VNYLFNVSLIFDVGSATSEDLPVFASLVLAFKHIDKGFDKYIIAPSFARFVCLRLLLLLALRGELSVLRQQLFSVERFFTVVLVDFSINAR